MLQNLQLPEYTKSDENCRLHGANNDCCNGLNYLRPHQCTGYCVAKVGRWLRHKHPELDDATIEKTVAALIRKR